MIQTSRLRRAAVAAIVLAGSVHLSTASPVKAAALSGADACEDWAYNVASAYCSSKGARLTALGYQCNAEGTATIYVLECNSIAPNTPG